MIVLPIKALPNQQFSVILDTNQWDIHIRDVDDAVIVTLAKNGTIVVDNSRAVAGQKILQSYYQEDGNFAIISNNQSVPDYTQFGVNQFLVYVSQAELDAITGTPQDRISASYFDVLGGLPLRFAPEGYTRVKVVPAALYVQSQALFFPVAP